MTRWRPVQEGFDSHLSVEPQLSSAGSAGVDGEVGWLVNNAAQRLQSRAVASHLRSRGKALVYRETAEDPGNQGGSAQTLSGNTSRAAGRM